MEIKVIPSDRMTEIISRWTQLGAMFDVAPSGSTPDVERLIIDTACIAASHARLAVVMATWLALHGDYVDDDRLAKLIGFELNPDLQPALGFLLEWATQRGAFIDAFQRSIRACHPASDGMPFMEIERNNPALATLTKQRASPISLKWGRWFEEFEPKTRAIRPRRWIAEQNPSLAARSKVPTAM